MSLRKLRRIESIIRNAQVQAEKNRKNFLNKDYKTKNTIIYFHAINNIKDILEDGYVIYPILRGITIKK